MSKTLFKYPLCAISKQEYSYIQPDLVIFGGHREINNSFRRPTS